MRVFLSSFPCLLTPMIDIVVQQMLSHDGAGLGSWFHPVKGRAFIWVTSPSGPAHNEHPWIVVFSVQTIDPIWQFPCIHENSNQVWHAFELPHAQFVFLFGKQSFLGATEDEQAVSSAEQMPHLVAWEIVAKNTIAHAALDGARPGFALLISQQSICKTAVALDILNRVILVPVKFSPSIDQFLSDSRIVRSRCA
jgi:hypothetical protein